MIPKRGIYFDNAATTRTRSEVIREIKKFFKRIYANPSSIHRSGIIAKGSLELARERIANVLNCNSEEIIFTGSGTESNNLAIRGIAKALKKNGNHIITTKIEHSSVLKTCEDLENQGFKVTYLDVNNQGLIDLKKLEKSITPKTILVSIMYANNEIGTIQPINEIIKIVKSKKVLFHTDAVQLAPYKKINLKELNVDLLSISGHKIYAPKGVGILYVKENTKIKPIITGGGQEFGLRSGTENIPYIMGLSKALMLNNNEKEKYLKNILKLRNMFLEGIKNKIPDIIFTGHPQNRIPNIISFCLKDISGRELVRELSHFNIEISSGSACSSPDKKPSHVIEALNIPEEYVNGSVRISLGKYNTEEEIRYLLKILPDVVKKLRGRKKQDKTVEAFISKEELRDKINKKKNLQIIDVRPAPFPGKALPNSVYIPIWKLKRKFNILDKNKETIIICYQGDIFSPEAYYFLIKKGFKNIKILKGGLFNYTNYKYKSYFEY